MEPEFHPVHASKHASVVANMLAWSGWNLSSILTTLADSQQN